MDVANQQILRIGTRGLASHERALLNNQLRMLKGRTRAQWALADDNEATQVLILGGEVAAGGRATALVSGAPRVIDWPVRLFGLIELLGEAETRILHDSQTPLLSAHLASLQAATAFALPPWTLVIEPDRQAILTDCPSLVPLAKALLSAGAPLAPQPLPVGDGSLKPLGLAALRWSLALRETAGAQRFAQPAATFRIEAWPSFGEWESSAELLRLAALYSRHEASLEQGARFAGCSQDQVALFLHACSQCGLGVHRGEPPPEYAASPGTGESSLLKRLRARLGLVFGKG